MIPFSGGFRLPASSLQRMRLLMLSSALVGLVVLLPGILVDRDLTPVERLGASLVAVVVGVYWLRGYRDARFLGWAEFGEAAVVCVLTSLSTGEPLLALFVVLLRSLYGSALSAAIRVPLYVAVLAAADALGEGAGGRLDAGRTIGLVAGIGIAFALKSALERVERSEQRLRAVLEGSSDVATVVDEKGLIRWQAASARSVLGLDPTASRGRSFLELVHPDEADAVTELMARAGGRPEDASTAILRMPDATGELREMEVTAVDRRTDPHVRGYVLNLRDATERRRLAAEQAATERLRHRVEEQRRRQELEARLQRSERLEQVGQLAGGIAHDFNNLLSIILNITACMPDDLPADSQSREDVRQIEEAAQRGAVLTRQLLLFGQRRPSAHAVIDLDDVVGDISTLLAHSVGDGVDLEILRTPELWRVEADVANLEHALVNLVVNARDAVGPAGAVAVATRNVILAPEAAVDLDAPPGWYVELSVTDDGCGMDAATRKRALEPFFTTKDVGKGTGLGLSSVYGIVTGAGGAVDIDSEPGRGTSVRLLLPATASPPPAVPA